MFVKLADVGPSAAAFYRVLIGGVVLFGIAVYRRYRLTNGSRPAALVTLAAVLFALDLMLWHRSIGNVGPGLATLLANFQVFVLAGAGIIFLGERPTGRLAAAIPIAVMGLFLIVGLRWNDVASSYRTGVIAGLLAAAAYGGYLLVLRQSQSSGRILHPVVNLGWISIATASLLLWLTPVQGESLVIPDLETGMVLAAYALVAQVAGWLLISYGLPGLGAGRAGLILLLQPTLAFVWDVLFFHRTVHPAELIGALLALAGIYLGTTSRT